MMGGVCEDYRGRLSYSGLGEAVRVFFYVVISMGVTIPVMIYLGKLSPVMKISNVWLLVHSATTFFIMFGLRILIRYAYYFLTTVPNKMKRVFVYGSDPNSITMAQMLTSDVASLYKPVAILDSEVSFKGMRLGSVPILKMANDFNGLIKLIATYRVEKIIFNEEQLNKLPADRLDMFLASGLKLMISGVASDYSDRKRTRLKSSHIQKSRMPSLA